MHPTLPAAFAALLALTAGAADPLYLQNFDQPESIGDFLFTDPSLWKIGEEDGNRFLELTGKKSNYQPPYRSPTGIALLRNFQVGDFVLEVDVLQTTAEYGHRDACLFFGYQNPSQFYYTHLATRQDDHAHQIFRVAHAPRVKFTSTSTGGVDWGDRVWRKLRLERKGAEISVSFDGVVVQQGRDDTFPVGWLGLGSFDDTVRFDNLRVTAPRPADQRAPDGYDRFGPVAAFAAPPDLQHAAFRPLFNGRDLSGWSVAQGGARFTVDGETILGVCRPEDKVNSFLRTEAEYGDFILAGEVKVEVLGNSGVQFRSRLGDATVKRVHGYQLEIDHRLDRRWTGGIYEEGRRGWLYPLADEAKGSHPERAFAGRAYRPAEWNTFILQARGNRLQTWVNGVATADLVDAAPEAISRGFIALQVHAGPQGTIRWRNLRLRELP